VTHPLMFLDIFRMFIAHMMYSIASLNLKCVQSNRKVLSKQKASLVQ